MGKCASKQTAKDGAVPYILMADDNKSLVSEASLLPCHACDRLGCSGLACAQCFMMVKSHAVPRTEEIIAWLAARGVEVTKRKVIPDTQLPTMHALYAEHIGKWYFKRLICSVMEGVVALAVRSSTEGMGDAEFIAGLRTMIGPSDMSKAVEGTLRFEFGEATPNNAVHCSDSPEAAVRELTLMFHSTVEREYTSSALESTCLRHALHPRG